MRISTLEQGIGVFFLAAAAGAGAEQISVSPGPGALAAGLARAHAGDVVKIAPGEFAESVSVGAGVTIEGAGAGRTVIAAPQYAALNCGGAGIRIVGLTVRGGSTTVRGVNSSAAVRVERCRFENLKEAVALMEAPLSDVIACEFAQCEIGIRAIGGASPTVWGCAFQGGTMGVFGMGGSPYIRNNLFDGVKTGIRLAANDSEPGIVRNNVFLRCENAGIELMSRQPLVGTSIRNCVFVQCGAALIAPAQLATAMSHVVLHQVKTPAVRDREGQETLKPGDPSITEADVSVTVGKDLAVRCDPPQALAGRGLRLCSESQSAAGTIGLEKTWSRVRAGAAADLPPQRLGGKFLIANAVLEEHQHLKTLARRMEKQSLETVDGIHVDRVTLGDGGEPKELLFDVSRFFGEESVR